VDLYNGSAFPRDEEAKPAIDVGVELKRGTGTEGYLAALEGALAEAAARCEAPDLIIYNAGTDVLAGDALGGLGVSPAGVVARDERVFRFAAERGAPIVLLLSGGYSPASAGVIAASLENLVRVFGLNAPPAELRPRLAAGAEAERAVGA
jgi:histone deacetylase 11